MTRSAPLARRLFALAAAGILTAKAAPAACTLGEAEPPVGIRHPALGPVYPNIEPDFIDAAEAAAASAVDAGEWRRRSSAEARALAAWADAPASAGPLPRAVEALECPLRPVAAALFECLERLGQTESPGGAAPIAALLANWQRTLLFIDGEDPAQLAFAERFGRTGAKAAGLADDKPAAEAETPRPDEDGGARALIQEAEAAVRSGGALPTFVLTAGRVSELARRLPPALAKRVRFDQGGSLRRALGLSAGPSMAALEARLITVRTIPIDESGRPLPMPVRRLPLRDQPLPAALRREAEEAVRRLADAKAPSALAADTATSAAAASDASR